VVARAAAARRRDASVALKQGVSIDELAEAAALEPDEVDTIAAGPDIDGAGAERWTAEGALLPMDTPKRCGSGGICGCSIDVQPRVPDAFRAFFHLIVHRCATRIALERRQFDMPAPGLTPAKTPELYGFRWSDAALSGKQRDARECRWGVRVTV
jgi:hypothetical protein